MAEHRSDMNYELITKYLADEASPDEHNKVTHWINASPDNRQAFLRMKEIWEKTGKIIPVEPAEVDVDAAWKKFSKKMRLENDPGSGHMAGKTRNLSYYFSRVAAVLLIGFAVYFIYQRLAGPSVKRKQLIASNEVVTSTLPDGSFVTLNNHSELIFPEKFTRDKRRVLLYGEAFFEVTPDPKKPFIVKLGEAEVVVLGTSFYVRAYDSLNFITVGVEEGRVKSVAAETHIILNGGERITLNKMSGEYGKIKPYDPNDVYWKSKTLTFRDKDLSTVFKTLEKTYGVGITVQDEAILHCRITATFREEKIDHILRIIRTNFNLTVQDQNGEFIISGGGCK